MSAKQLQSLSFNDQHGATITIPGEALALYSTVKSDQLAVLNRILADRAAGFVVHIDDNAICSLAGLAGELANACNEFMCMLSGAFYVPQEDAEAKKGGDQ